MTILFELTLKWTENAQSLSPPWEAIWSAFGIHTKWYWTMQFYKTMEKEKT